MNLKVFCVSFINLLVALAVTAANAKTRHHLTDECYEHASAFFGNKNIKFEDFQIIKEDEHIYVPSTILKREGVGKVNIKAVKIENKEIQNFYGLQFNWKNQSIIDCRSWYNTPLIILVETYDYYTPFLMEDLNAIKVSTHDLVNCGSPCHYAQVNSVYIIDDISYEPFSRTEISTPIYEYPSKMFIDYLTLDEVYQFMKTGDGFENFEWRGKNYTTSDLKRKLVN